MMSSWNVLEEINQKLEAEISHLSKLVSEITVPNELINFKQQLINLFEQLQSLVNISRIYINSRRSEALGDILSYTQWVKSYLTLVNKYLLTAISRTNDSDRLILNIVQWLHSIHKETSHFPAAFIDGGPSIRPFVKLPPIPMYYFPISVQRSLLYMPLLFHEFGHLVFAVHEPEMKDLIQQFQTKIQPILAPISQRADGYAQNQSAYRQSIAYKWYTWLHELFCDAVGFTIGGPSYIYAFSEYLTSVEKSNFFLSREDIEKTNHPTTWLRIKLLTERIEVQGYASLAQEIRNKWANIASLLNIQEDYYGYYVTTLNREIHKTIDDMLTETSPRLHTDDEANARNWVPENDSPIKLLNYAWSVYLENPDNYFEWENHQIALLLNLSERADV